MKFLKVDISLAPKNLACVMGSLCEWNGSVIEWTILFNITIKAITLMTVTTTNIERLLIMIMIMTTTTTTTGCLQPVRVVWNVLTKFYVKTYGLLQLLICGENRLQFAWICYRVKYNIKWINAIKANDRRYKVLIFSDKGEGIQRESFLITIG